MVWIHIYNYHYNKLISASIRIKMKQSNIAFFSEDSLGKGKVIFRYSLIRQMQGINCLKNIGPRNKKSSQKSHFYSNVRHCWFVFFVCVLFFLFFLINRTLFWKSRIYNIRLRYSNYFSRPSLLFYYFTRGTLYTFLTRLSVRRSVRQS